MNPRELELHYPLCDRLPEEGARLDLRDGIAWIRMPLPFALDHINLWLLRDRFEGREGWTLVDCGASTSAIRECWSKLIDAPQGGGGLDGLPILRVVCTHMHPDHVGLAAMLVRRFDCALWMTVGEYALCRILAQPPDDEQDRLVLAFCRSLGMADPVSQALGARRGTHAFHRLVPELPPLFRRIRDGESIRIGRRSWKVITGCGHSPEHASLYSDCSPSHPQPADASADELNSNGGSTSDPILISGDMVLPRISTNTAVWEIEPESNPVQWYLESIRRLSGCNPQTLVLPSHGRPFVGLHRRIEQLCLHHEERLREVRNACAEKTCSALDIVPIMFRRPLDGHQLGFALGEALGHLHALWYAGELTRWIDANGVIRFHAAQAEDAHASSPDRG
jgi:glyoxylase-like metal-dependent hydrolase (beta-lactamase superfamily II)